MYYKAISGTETGPVNDTASNIDQYINDLVDETYANIGGEDYVRGIGGSFGSLAGDV